jgi:hypothetical protein
MAVITIALLFLIPHLSLVSASSFSTNCTYPHTSTNFVSSPNTRGTFDILWSCLFTIFICIWTVQHFNIPEQRDGRDEGWRGDLKWGLKKFTTRLRWMIITLILPEYLMGMAIGDRLNVSRLLKKARKLRLSDGSPLPKDELRNWTKTHVYFGDMGGYLVRTITPRVDGQGVMLVHICSDEVLDLREKGIIKALPTIYAHQIKDMSSANIFVKAAAIIQVIWMVIQAIGRRAAGLPVTQLEIETCAFAVQAFLTYLMWWGRPQGIQTCVELSLSAPIEADELLPLVQEYSSFNPFRGNGKNDRLDSPFNNGSSAENEDSYNDISILMGVICGAIVLGGIQLFAWNYDFPTTVEKVLWRYLSILTIISVIVPVGVFAIWYGFINDNSSTSYGITYILWTGGVFYFFARLFILIESIRSLFYLPPEAFIATWSTGIPHLA